MGYQARPWSLDIWVSLIELPSTAHSESRVVRPEFSNKATWSAFSHAPGFGQVLRILRPWTRS